MNTEGAKTHAERLRQFNACLSGGGFPRLEALKDSLRAGADALERRCSEGVEAIARERQRRGAATCADTRETRIDTLEAELRWVLDNCDSGITEDEFREHILAALGKAASHA